MKATRKLVLNALLMGIIIIMSLVPFFGFITVGPIAITIIHIPVLVGAILFGYSTGFLLSLTFGLCSWFVAATRAVGIADLAFVNPLVSVLPRLIFGFVTVFLYQLINKLAWKDNLKVALTCFLATLIHSFVTLFALFTELNLAGDSAIILAVKAFFALNILIEALVAVVICTPVISALRKVVD